MRTPIQHLGVFTSGGDAPGMNACIRAVVRSGIQQGMQVSGIWRGYEGMIDGDFMEMNSRSVSNIIQRGGTILKSARSSEFRTPEGRKMAYQNLQKQGIDALVAIGGDGTFTGAVVFNEEYGMPIVGVPGTIDNDLFGTDFTLGFDTAVSNVVDAVDKIRDTADSHDRVFFIEVMGRDTGFIALSAGIAGGAEAILLPETPTNLDLLADELKKGAKKGKSSNIIIVAEGDDGGGAFEVAAAIKKRLPNYDTRVSILGHTQRGGTPTWNDRVLGSRLGTGAVNALAAGHSGTMVGLLGNQLTSIPLKAAIGQKKELDLSMANNLECLIL